MVSSKNMPSSLSVHTLSTLGVVRLSNSTQFPLESANQVKIFENGELEERVCSA